LAAFLEELVMTTTEPHSTEDIAALFRGRLGAEAQQRLHAHVAGCVECRRAYDRHAAAEAALAPASLSSFTQDRIAARLFGETVAPRSPSKIPMVLGLVATLGVTGLVLMPRTDELTARGGPEISANLGARAMLLARTASGDFEAADLSSRAARPGDFVAVAASSIEADRWARVFVRLAGGRVEPIGAARRLDRGSDDLRIAGFEVSTEWPPGALEVIVVFDEGALPLDDPGTIDPSRARVFSGSIEAPK
jgi:hypothetical protein